MPLFRYGLPDAMRHWGVTRELELWSVAVKRGAGPERRVDADRVAAAIESARTVVLRFDPNRSVLVPTDGAGR